ncbi:hypothetical protein ADK59_26430 [Streptomyces sp. XY332]|nr:hypothetical protein ADK59_26430 [Streptomyces sp. XY332]
MTGTAMATHHLSPDNLEATTPETHLAFSPLNRMKSYSVSFIPLPLASPPRSTLETTGQARQPSASQPK